MKTVIKNYVYLLVGLIVATAVGTFVATRLTQDGEPIDDGRIIGGTAAAIGFIVSAAALLLWNKVSTSRSARFGSRVNLRLDLKKNALFLVKFVAILYGILVLFHSITGGSLSSGLAMTASDISLARKCPTEIKTISSFIVRTGTEDDVLMLGDAMAVHQTVGDPFRFFGKYPTRDLINEYICEVGWAQAATEIKAETR